MTKKTRKKIVGMSRPSLVGASGLSGIPRFFTTEGVLYEESNTYSKTFSDSIVMEIYYMLINSNPWSSVVKIKRHNVVKFFRKYKMDISPSRFINLVKTFDASFSKKRKNMEKLGIFLDTESRNNKLEKILK